MSDFRNLIGVRLKALRKERGLSLEEVGQAIGVTGSHISQIEKGVRQPSLELIGAFAEYFNYSPVHFVNEENSSFGVGNEIKRLRTEKYLSLGDLSHKTGINYFKLGEAEQNRERLSDEELAKLAEVLGVEREYLCKSPEYYIERVQEMAAVIFGLEEDELNLLTGYIKDHANIAK